MRPPTTLMARQRTPLPSLDQYVSEHLSSRGGVRGSTRAWSIEYGQHRDKKPISITYQIRKNQFCEIIGRAHKSNNIYWTIDLNSWTCIQGCWDPECFGRGSPIPIISNVCVPVAGNKGERKPLDQIKQEFESWQEGKFEKALMELNLDDIIVTAPPPANNEKLSVVQLDLSINQRMEANEEALNNDVDDDLSDEALLQAIVNNPEMFP